MTPWVFGGKPIELCGAIGGASVKQVSAEAAR